MPRLRIPYRLLWVALMAMRTALPVWAGTAKGQMLTQEGEPIKHWAVGANYTGFQLRYQFSTRWAAEGRAQFGSADSDYGDVRSNVFGLRGYRFFPVRTRLAWFAGAEAAYAKAVSQNSSYETKGFALGGFGGMEYRATKRIAISMDIGPYIISLRESQTQLTQTTLDFVINSAVNIYLF